MDDEFEEEIDTKQKRLPKVAKVKNKAAAPVQITAEQLLREAKERQLEFVPPPPKQKITDPDELQEYRLRKRKFFEDNIRKNRSTVANWLKYGAWEESQKEIQRARSIYERALDMNHRNVTIWLKYAEMEMKHRQVNHARNIWDRAVTILPRNNQFWYKYTYMEEMLGNIPNARQVFERWMEWEPEEQAWLSYIKMEMRYKEANRARAVYESFVMCHPVIKNWIRFAKFEEHQQNPSNARIVFERAIEYYGDDNMDQYLFIAFARFEESQREFDRVRCIYKYALDKIPKQNAQELFKNYTTFEKRFGDRSGIEDVIVNKRKFQYEEEVKENPNNYDAWFDYLRLIEADGDIDTIREVYERAISNIPPIQEKKSWRRYIYLWIMYAVFEELTAKDMDRTRQVYKASLEVIPHKRFTFAKVWLFYAQFEIRQKNLKAARLALGSSLGKCAKDKLFREYISLELQLREFDRCRKLYEKFLEFNPSNCTTWIKYAEMETILGDIDRARAIYELAISQTMLDMPEVLWKAYIDFEIGLEEYDRTREIYERLLQRTQHVKVWISYAEFETTTNEDACIDQARSIFKRANDRLKGVEHAKEERMMILEAWKKFELQHGDTASQMSIDKKLPRKVKKRRKIQTEDLTDAGWEEYYDYIFPDDQDNQPNFKLLQMAKMWKQTEDSSSDSDSENEEKPSNSENSNSKNIQNSQTSEDVVNESESDSDEEEEEPSKKLPLPLPLDIDKDEEFNDSSSEEEDE